MSEITTVGTVSPVKGWIDIGVRTVKTFVAYLIGAGVVDALLKHDLNAAKDILYAAGGAAATIVINAILAWTQKK